jgi:hypothetical protein
MKKEEKELHDWYVDTFVPKIEFIHDKSAVKVIHGPIRK